jgi:hypothetical protein
MGRRKDTRYSGGLFHFGRVAKTPAIEGWGCWCNLFFEKTGRWDKVEPCFETPPAERWRNGYE